MSGRKRKARHIASALPELSGALSEKIATSDRVLDTLAISRPGFYLCVIHFICKTPMPKTFQFQNKRDYVMWVPYERHVTLEDVQKNIETQWKIPAAAQRLMAGWTCPLYEIHFKSCTCCCHKKKIVYLDTYSKYALLQLTVHPEKLVDEKADQIFQKWFTKTTP